MVSDLRYLMNCKIRRILSFLLVLSLLPTFPVFGATDDTVVHSFPQEKKRIALTFDDGPHPQRTEEILKILKEYGVTATFFVIGENVELYPEIIEKEICDGHEIGNHTLSHKSLLKADYSMAETEIGNLNDILLSRFDYESNIIRPPGGQYNDEVCKYAKDNGYKIIIWSVDTRDWAHTPVDTIIENVKNNVSNGAIILFHDYIGGNSPTPEALRKLIPYLKSNGYEFVSVSDLIYSEN